MKLTDLCPRCSQSWSAHMSDAPAPRIIIGGGACGNPRPSLLRIVSPQWTLAQATFVGAVLTHAIDDLADAGATGDELRDALAELQRASQ